MTIYHQQYKAQMRQINGKPPVSQVVSSLHGAPIEVSGETPTGDYASLLLENEFAENNYFAKSIFAKTAIYIGNYDTSAYVMLSYASDNLTSSATKLTIYDYLIERSAASTLKLHGNANITGNLDVDGNVQVDGNHVVTGELTAATVNVTGNLSITGTIDRYNQTELNIGDTFINLGTAQAVAADGGIRMYGPGNTLLSTFKYIAASTYWNIDKSFALTSNNKLAFNNDPTNYYLKYEDTTYGIKGNSLYGWSLYGNGNLGLRINASGNIGLATTDIENWESNWISLEAYQSALMMGKINDSFYLLSNLYYNGSWKYKRAGYGSLITAGGGNIRVIQTEASGLENSAATLSTHFYIDYSGKVGFNTTPSYFLHAKKDQNTDTHFTLENITVGTNSRTLISILNGTSYFNFNNFSTGYSSPYTALHEIYSDATNGIAIYNPNKIRLQNTRTTDALTITGGNFLFNGNQQSEMFTSGWAGSGWKLNNTYADLELNTLTVRGTLSVYELLIQQIRAVAGMQIVSPGNGKVASVTTATSGHEVIVIDDPSGIGATNFAANDIVICQRVAINGSTLVKRIVRRVLSITGTSVTFTKDGDMPTDTATVAEGDEYVTIGNTTNTARQGLVMISSSETYSPYVDVISGVNSWTAWTGSSKTKARLGRKDGITDTSAGLDGTQVNDYGLYSQNVNLSGKIYATSGRIGLTDYWNFTTTGLLYAGTAQQGGGAGVELSAQNKYIQCYPGEDDWVKLYYINGTNYGFDVAVNRNVTVHFGSGTNYIGPWNFTATSFYNGYTLGAGLGIELNGSSKYISVASAANSYVKMYTTSTSDWGVIGIKSGSTYFQLGSTNTIAAFNFDTASMWSGQKLGAGVGIELNSTSKYIAIAGATTSYVKMWAATSSDWGIKGVTAGTTYFQLGNVNQIASMQFDDYRIYSDFVFMQDYIDGKNTYSSIGVGATERAPGGTGYSILGGGFTRNSSGYIQLDAAKSDEYRFVVQVTSGQTSTNNIFIAAKSQDNYFFAISDYIGFIFNKGLNANTIFKINDLPIHNYSGEPSIESGRLYLVLVSGRYQLFVKS